jgi:hypothetical protein
MTENQRLKFIMNALHFKTQAAFAEKLDIQPGSLSDIFREKKNIGVSGAIKNKLAQQLAVNITWFETGIGQPFLDKSEHYTGVPYYNINLADIDAEASLFEEDTPEYHVNYRPFNDCTAYLPVYGDSMYPKYAAGEIIAVKQIKNLEVIQWGEAYVVITTENTNGLKSIKTLHEHTDPTKIILKSSNPNFRGETVVKKTDILSLYLIKGKITRNMI